MIILIYYCVTRDLLKLINSLSDITVTLYLYSSVTSDLSGNIYNKKFFLNYVSTYNFSYISSLKEKSSFSNYKHFMSQEIYTKEKKYSDNFLAVQEEQELQE